ncbi:hypothetical protein ACTXT7_006339 [Hymenolepis weldensis]
MISSAPPVEAANYDMLLRLTCSQTKVPLSHIDLSLGGPIQGISNPILMNSYSRRSEVILIKSATTSAIINSLRHKVAIHGMPKVTVLRCHPVLFCLI